MSGRTWYLVGALFGLTTCAAISSAVHAPIPAGYAWCVDACPTDVVRVDTRADAAK